MFVFNILFRVGILVLSELGYCCSINTLPPIWAMCGTGMPIHASLEFGICQKWLSK